MPPARRDRLRRRPPGAAPPQPSALHRLSRRRCTASAAGAAPPQPPAPQRAQPPSARMISRQKAGKSGGVRDVMTLPSTTTSRSEEHTSELQSRENLVCRLLLEKKKR